MNDFGRAITANRVLVIDDDPEVGAMIGNIARQANFDVIVTIDPADFKQKVRSWRPAIIIMDLGMPDMDGIELLRHLADERVAARILIVSGFDQKILGMAERLGAARGLNMCGVVQKPVRNFDLTRILVNIAHDLSAVTARRLEAGLDANEFYLEYQPKMDLPTMRPVGAEALLRWKHPELGIVPPTTFIPVAEETDLIHRLTEWVLSEALRQQSAWAAQDIPLTVAVNLSAKNLEDGDFAELVMRSCRLHAVEPGRLTLELTESAAMRDVERSADTLTRLRLKGVGMSIDDFGTGYSSLVQLQRLPFSEIKIDKSFVIECTASKDNAVIVNAIVDLAHRLGLKTVAEGVETEAALRFLLDARCDAVQGFHFSRPMAGDGIPAWYRQSRSYLQ